MNACLYNPKDVAFNAGGAKHRVYIAGPMTGLPDFNYPTFNAVAARLRAAGYEVENPAENPKPANETWGEYMRLALLQMLSCHSVALLPGWQLSRGALLEHYIAQSIGMVAVPEDRYL